MYRDITAQDAFGHITEASLGNGVMESRSYDAGTGWVQALSARLGSVAVHQLSYSEYDSFGNLKYYSNNATNVSESYSYDDVHRLIQSTTSGAGVSVGLSYGYDAVGNMLHKSDYGSSYKYGNSSKNLGGNAGPNAVRQVTKAGGSIVNFSYDNEGNLQSGDGLAISYSSFKQPTSISRSGSSFSFSYGARLERVKEVRNSLTTYEIDKAYEQSSDGSWKLYLDDIAIISYDNTDGHRIAYSHKDRLGSSVTFTDHNGQVTGRRHYDAFGKPRVITGALMEPAYRPKQLNFTDFAGVDNAGITRRGFTDHRHLDEAGLIHMNGRGYDYNLGRFLSVDPVIQSPGNSQSLNPYSYIMNNPLAGTDPTGYCAAETGTRIKSCVDVVAKDSDTGDVVSKTSVNIMHSGAASQISNFASNAFGNGGSINGVKAVSSDGTTKSMDFMSQNQVSVTNQNQNQNQNESSVVQDAAQGIGAYLGQQLGDAGAARDQYNKRVSELDPSDSLGRKAIKAETRAITPKLVNDFIEKKRPSTDAKPGSGGTANRTNSKVNILAEGLKLGGRVLLLTSLASQAYEVFTSEDKSLAMMRSSFGVAGAIGGGIVGGVGGSMIAPGPGTAIGGVAGSALGGSGGEEFGQWLHRKIWARREGQ